MLESSLNYIFLEMWLRPTDLRHIMAPLSVLHVIVYRHRLRVWYLGNQLKSAHPLYVCVCVCVYIYIYPYIFPDTKSNSSKDMQGREFKLIISTFATFS